MVLPGRLLRSRGRGISESLDAIRLVVLLFVVLDAATILTATLFDWEGHGPTGPVAVLQAVLIAAAAASVMWHGLRWAALPLLVVAGLAVVHGPSGTEFWLVLILGVALALRAHGWPLLIGIVGLLSYAALFGAAVERRDPGWGWAAGLTTAGFALVALAIGFGTRRLLRARDQWRTEVTRVRAENVEIRTVERARLADDLQLAVTRGLAEISAIVDGARSGDAATLRRSLTMVDARCRSLLAELRVLLEVLRSDPLAAEALPAAASTRALPSGRTVRIAISVVLGVLALRSLADAAEVISSGGALDPGGLGVELLALASAGLAVFWRTPGMIAAGVALVASALLSAPGHWDVLPAAVLSLALALAHGLRGLLAVLAGLVAYGGLLILTGDSDPMLHLLLVGYVAVLALVAGLVVRHLLHVRADSGRKVQDLMAARRRVEADERHGLARELHDVVAHQLSNSTLMIMATSSSQDPARLRETLERVGQEAETAHHELAQLLATMRDSGSTTDDESAVTPATSATILADGLIGHGHQPVMDIDPAAGALDATTQRTLTRIMREATTNILRYAPPNSECRYTLVVADDEARLDVDSPVRDGDRIDAFSLGWGLRGIRERVQLVHGRFEAGPHEGRWRLSVGVPVLAVAASGSVATPPAERAGTQAPLAMGVEGTGEQPGGQGQQPGLDLDQVGVAHTSTTQST